MTKRTMMIIATTRLRLTIFGRVWWLCDGVAEEEDGWMEREVER